MNLNAPLVDCEHCKGTGCRVRELRLVIKGLVMPYITRVALHCSCLSPDLKALHQGFDKDPVLRDWPWDELESFNPPKEGTAPLGCPFPPDFIRPLRPKPLVSPKPAPREEEPAPEKPKKRGRSKVK